MAHPAGNILRKQQSQPVHFFAAVHCNGPDYSRPGSNFPERKEPRNTLNTRKTEWIGATLPRISREFIVVVLGRSQLDAVVGVCSALPGIVQEIGFCATRMYLALRGWSGPCISFGGSWRMATRL